MSFIDSNLGVLSKTSPTDPSHLGTSMTLVLVTCQALPFLVCMLLVSYQWFLTPSSFNRLQQQEVEANRLGFIFRDWRACFKALCRRGDGSVSGKLLRWSHLCLLERSPSVFLTAALPFSSGDNWLRRSTSGSLLRSLRHPCYSKSKNWGLRWMQSGSR